MKDKLRKIVREIMKEKVISELDEAQSPAQKAAFEKMLAKKDGKDESVVAESFADPLEGFPQAYKDLLKKLQRSNDRGERSMLINKMNVIRKKLKLKPLTNESVNEEIDTKKANQIRKAAAGYVGPKFAKKASDEDILAMADLKDEKASLYNRHLKDIMGKISKLQKKYNIKESIIKEGFSTWEVIFDNMNLSGVKLSKKNKYTIKARNTVEAIKKAAKMAGVKDGQWIATKTHSVTKK